MNTTSSTLALPPEDVDVDVDVEETQNFYHIGGVVMDFKEMAARDWDEVYNGVDLSPRTYTSWNALNIIRLTLATWIIASHIALVVFVFAKRSLRVQAKNLLIVNVALANMIMGVFIIPAKLHFILNPDDVKCDTAVAWDFIANYFQSSVALFAVLSLVFERFVYVYTEKNQKRVLRLAGTIGTILLLVAPWILSALFLIPTYFRALLAKSKDSNLCLYKTDDDFFLACHLLAFVPASLGVFVLAPFTGLLDCLRPRSCFYKPLTPKGETMTVTAFVSLSSIFCEAPFCIVRALIMRMQCEDAYCSRLNEMLAIAMWIRLGKTALFPFIWLAYTDIREAMLCHFGPDREYYDEVKNEDERELARYPGRFRHPHARTDPVNT